MNITITSQVVWFQVFLSNIINFKTGEFEGEIDLRVVVANVPNGVIVISEVKSSRATAVTFELIPLVWTSLSHLSYKERLGLT